MMAKLVSYPEAQEQVVALGALDDESVRLKARHGCASQRSKFAWMRFDVCVERAGGKLPEGLSKMRNSRDVDAMFRAFLGTAHLQLKELFGVIALSAANEPLGFAVVGTGGVREAAVVPLEVFKPAVLLPAAAIIVCHNHPSGNPTPSAADLELTDKLMDTGDVLGIPLLDHLILTENGYFSFLDSGLMRRRR